MSSKWLELLYLVKSIVPVDARNFVIASQQKHGFRVADFLQKKIQDRFETLRSPINIVAKEKILELCCIWLTNEGKNSQQVSAKKDEFYFCFSPGNPEAKFEISGI